MPFLSHTIHNKLKRSPYDKDASAFFRQIEDVELIALSTTQKNAINTLIQSLKSNLLWTSMSAIYPFIGGQANAHKYNLKDARNLDAAFRLSFSGGWTHSSTGALPNGTNGYADTFLAPSVVLSQDSTHFSYYSRTDTAASARLELGTMSDNTFRAFIIFKWSSLSYSSVNTSTDNTYTTLANSAKYIITSRTGAGAYTVTVHGTSEAKTTASTGLSLNNFYLAAFNRNASPDNYSDKECAFATIGSALTQTEAETLHTIVQTYQTSLSRNV